MTVIEVCGKLSHTKGKVFVVVCGQIIEIGRPNYCKVPCKRPPPPLKHKFLRKVGVGRLLGTLPFVQRIIQPLKVQVNTKRLEFKQKSYIFQF